MLLLKPYNYVIIKKYFPNYNFLPYRYSFLTTVSKLNNRFYHATSSRKTNDRTPEIVYFPQIIRWLKTKIGLKLLQKAWDPEFSEGAFIYGSVKAICRITEVISTEDKNDELKYLVTPELCGKLQTDMKIHLSELQKKMIILTPKDIKLLIPVDIRLSNINNKKICQICLRSLAVKWQDFNGLLRLVLVAIQTDFERDYTNNNKSEWIVHVFDILECGIVETKTKRKRI